MPNFLKIALLGLLCLLGTTFPASSQRRPVPGIAPLHPHIVRLDSGTTTKRPLVGIDTATWRSIRVNEALDQRQLAERAAQLRQWHDLHVHDSLSTVRVAKELRSTRVDNAALSTAFSQQEERANKALALPLRPPLLFDGHFWTGTGVGAAALVALKLFLFH